MPERRRSKRRHLLYYLRVYNSRTGRLLGHLVDISNSGIMVVSGTRRRLGRTIRLRMTMPGPKPREAPRIEFEATTRWCRRDVNPDLWDTGLEMSPLTRRQANELETLVDDYGLSN